MSTGDPGSLALEPATGSKPAPAISDRDIIFTCPNCQGQLVVDRDGAGLTVPCSHCGQALTIPDYQAPPIAETSSLAAEAADPTSPHKRHFDFRDKPREELERRFNELKHQFKENRSQDTEMRGHVNRATMELHRLQLKLKKLQERHLDIGAEIHALAEWLDGANP
ncbi:MAG: hypothetical protein INR62_11185 [Rhodospirillales bacterium]|nr:hypothetical protein [Acetobacter sp.]